MIRGIRQRVAVLPVTVTRALALIDAAAVVPLMETWISEASAISAKPFPPRAVSYSPRAVLAGILVLITTCQPISWAALLQLFWCQLSRDSLVALGLDETVGVARQVRFIALAAQDSPAWPKDARRQLNSEYQRLIRSIDVIFDPLRWSPHSRRKKQTNQQLLHTVLGLGLEQKRTLQQCRERHDLVVNKIVAASVEKELLQDYLGDIMFDEVVIQVAKANGSTGTRPRKKHTGNPDAGWFRKGERDHPRWAVGATFIMSAHRKHEKRIPIVVLGMSLSKPTGGSVAEVQNALRFIQEEGLLPVRHGKARSRFVMADRGFTNKNDLNEYLIDNDYYLLQDFQSNVNIRRPLAEGAVLFNGILICPGFAPLTDRPLLPPARDAGENALKEHQQRTDHLLAGRMHPNGRPRKATRSGRGRPRKDEIPSADHRLEVVCPAAAGQCKCPAVPSTMELSPTLPTVLVPPNVLNPPKVCTSTNSTVLLGPAELKQYGVTLFGSVRHTELYGHARSLNEQWHSQLRASQTGGIDDAFFYTLGIERIGVIIALAVAETNVQMQRSFREKSGGPESVDKEETAS